MNRKCSPKSRASEPVKDAPYALNKKAFDSIIIRFRRMDRPLLGGMGAVIVSEGHGANMKNPVKPSALEFWADVLLAIKAAMPKGVTLVKFFTAYMAWDSDNEIERNTHAFKVLGGRCHSVEQRLGAEFIRRKIFPLEKYLNPPRVRPGRKV